MAADESPLTIALRAATDDFDKKMAKSMRGVYREVDQLQKKISQLGPSNDNAAARAVTGFNKAGHAAGQLSFQLNDIATSLAGGASPFQVMMQQGSQVTQVFQGMGGGIKGVAATIGGAFASMLSPMSLLTFGFIFLAGKAVEYFSASEDGADKSAKALAKEKQAIDAAISKWEELLPTLKAVREAREAALESSQIKAGTEAEIAQAYETIKDRLQTMGPEIRKVRSAMRELNTTAGDEAVNRFLKDLNELNDASGPTAEKLAALEEIAALMTKTLGAESAVVRDLNVRIAGLRQLMGGWATDAERMREEAERATPEQKKFNEALKEMSNIAKAQLTDAEALIEAYNKAIAAALQLTNAEAQRQAIGAATIDLVAGQVRVDNAAALASPDAGLKYLKEKAATPAIAASLDDLEDAMITALVKLFQRLPESARITSGVRSTPRQAEIYEENKRKPGGLRKHPAARPGHSLHETGQAVDIGEGVDMETLRAAVKLIPELEQLDVISKELYANDKVHVQLVGASRKARKAAAEESARAAEQEAELNARRDQAMLDYMAKLDTELSLQQRLAAIKMNSNLSDEEKLRMLAAEEELQTALNLAKEQHRTLSEQDIANIRRTAIERTNLKIATDAYTKTEKESADAMKNFSQQMAGMAQGAISGLIQDLRNGVEAGEAFNNMLNRIIDSLINMALQSLFSSQGLGGLLAGFFPTKQSGGMVGNEGGTRKISPIAFAGAPRYAAGGMVGLRPGEVPIIAHKGEMVIPKHLVGKNRGGGYVDNSSTSMGDVNIDMSGSGVVAADNEAAQKWGKQVQKLVQLEMVRESRPGGLLRKVPR